MREIAFTHSKFGRINTIALALLIGFTGCTRSLPQNTTQQTITPPIYEPPAEPNVISLVPQTWEILYSEGVPPWPSADPAGAWAFEFPSAPTGGHVNYIQTPFRVTTILHNLSLTFKVESVQPWYSVLDTGDIPPATFHIFFEQRGDDLIEPDGRWWAHGGYNLGSQDNQTITLTVPLTSDQWSNVEGATDPQRFAAAWKNVGWIGITFGGQFFWGHGVAMDSGTAKFVLINFQVN